MKKSFEPTFCCHSGREWQQIYIFTVAKNGAIRSWSCWRKLPLCQPSPNEIVADKGLSAPQFVALFVKTLNRVSIYCSPKLFWKKLTKIKSSPLLLDVQTWKHFSLRKEAFKVFPCVECKNGYHRCLGASDDDADIFNPKIWMDGDWWRYVCT
jgi:hypothetical protein